jgi:M6 family metalloprotease-like protein
MRRWGFNRILVASFSILFFTAVQGHAAGIEGSKCTKAGITKTVKKVTYICTKSNKALVWKKKVIVKPVTATPSASAHPTESASPTPTSTKPSFAIAIYAGGPGATAGQAGKKSEEIPAGYLAPNSLDNLKLWIYDPENHSRAFNSPGIWLQKSGGIWTWFGAANGFLTTKLAEGSYVFDVVEANGDQKKYARGRYSVTVNAAGELTIDGLSPNSQGFYSVSAILNSRRATELANFQPTTICQLKDQTGSANMSNAFPRGTGRLTTNGTIRALIIPVDFTDLVGSGNPTDIYKGMAEGTHDFYYKESKQTVNFQFTTLKEYLHLNVPVNTFNLGSYNGGDPGAFFKAGLVAADPLVDFSQFDVVYVLPPSTVQFKQIAYGPAFPNNVDNSPFMTADGPVLNGSVGGADAWQTLEGAQWKWMAHETGHLFGLFDWYTLDNTNPYGPWDIMSLNWSTAAIELNAWNRYISGWLTDSQMQCLAKSDLTSVGRDYTVETIGIDSESTKAVTIKLSDSMVLVMEARATAGLDQLYPTNSGLLVYTVDVSIPSIKGMAKTYSRPNVSGGLEDAPLRVGETITVLGVTIRVDSFANNVMSVHVSG